MTDGVEKRVSFIAPVILRPGELELEALVENAYDAVVGKIPIQEFVRASSPREAMDRIDELWDTRDWTFER